MKKEIRRTVDDHLPKWLHSRFLSAIHYIWEVKGQPKEETIKRVDNVWASGQFTDEEMSVIPKLQDIIETSDDWKKFKEMKKESVH